jgi:5-methylcytosine-specific restriction endonuclease McrA
MSTHSQKYVQHLSSDAWKDIRAAALERAGWRCQRCHSRGPLEVHHLTYERLGNEADSDLQALCGACHEKADREREAATAARQWEARINGWARAKYGADWACYHDSEEVEAEFVAWLERKGLCAPGCGCC